MPLLNYTTEIPTSKTILEIQTLLVKHGASAVLNEFDDNGFIVALSFKIAIDGREVGFKLPSDWRPVLQILQNEHKVPRRLKTQEQALKVGWRILKDWVEAQMAIIETRMASLDQVFLPYAITGDGRTLYDRVKEMNLLEAPKS